MDNPVIVASSFDHCKYFAKTITVIGVGRVGQSCSTQVAITTLTDPTQLKLKYLHCSLPKTAVDTYLLLIDLTDIPIKVIGI